MVRDQKKFGNHCSKLNKMSQLRAGADPKPVRVAGAISLYLVVKSHYGFTTVREMKYASQHCCDKTMDDKMALYRECCFPNCTKSWSINLLS